MAGSLINRTERFHWANTVCVYGGCPEARGPVLAAFLLKMLWADSLEKGPSLLSSLLTGALHRSPWAWPPLMISGGNLADLTLGQENPRKLGSGGAPGKEGPSSGERRVGVERWVLPLPHGAPGIPTQEEGPRQAHPRDLCRLGPPIIGSVVTRKTGQERRGGTLMVAL